MISPVKVAHFHFLDDVVADISTQNRRGFVVDLLDLFEVFIHDSLQDDFDQVVVEWILRFQSVGVLEAQRLLQDDFVHCRKHFSLRSSRVN